MASKRRKGRPRKPGQRYRNGNLRPKNEPAISPAAIAATQPHRAGLGEHAADQRAESELGRLCLRGHISALQHLAGQRYAIQWRAYLATLDAPRSPRRGHGRGNPCGGCIRSSEDRCACERAKRSWERSTIALQAADREAVVVIARVACWDTPCPPWALPVLCRGLDALAESLGLTARRKSVPYGNAGSERYDPVTHP